MRAVLTVEHDPLDATDDEGSGDPSGGLLRPMHIHLNNPHRTDELMSYLKHYDWRLRRLDDQTIEAQAPIGAIASTLGPRDLRAHVKAWQAFYPGADVEVAMSRPLPHTTPLRPVPTYAALAA